MSKHYVWLYGQSAFLRRQPFLSRLSIRLFEYLERVLLLFLTVGLIRKHSRFPQTLWSSCVDYV